MEPKPAMLNNNVDVVRQRINKRYEAKTIDLENESIWSVWFE